uniref:Peptidase S74 domain-containing protein n=1 Tax=viral metagenome TaxID=1070528 RepID=A0A6M3KCC2_9ZZZZ
MRHVLLTIAFFACAAVAFGRARETEFGNMAIHGNVKVDGTLGTTGTLTAAGASLLTGAVTMDSTLATTGAATIRGTVTAGSAGQTVGFAFGALTDGSGTKGIDFSTLSLTGATNRYFYYVGASDYYNANKLLSATSVQATTAYAVKYKPVSGGNLKLSIVEAGKTFQFMNEVAGSEEVARIDLSGNFRTDGMIEVTGANKSRFSGAVTMDKTLGTTGSLTVGGAAYVTGKLWGAAARFSDNVTMDKVLYTTGSARIGGTITALGTGHNRIAGPLVVNGNLTTDKVLYTTGSAHIGGAAYVTGKLWGAAARFSDNVTMDKVLYTTGSARIGGTITALGTGHNRIAGPLVVNGNLTTDKVLYTTGSAHIGGAAYVTGKLWGATAAYTGNVTVDGTLSSTGTMYVGANTVWHTGTFTAANHTDLTDTGETTLHYHQSDRDMTNHVGAAYQIWWSRYDTSMSPIPVGAAGTALLGTSSTTAPAFGWPWYLSAADGVPLRAAYVDTSGKLAATGAATFDSTVGTSDAISIRFNGGATNAVTLDNLNNGSLLLSPGTGGAIQASSSGNARGVEARDWQTSRTADTMVASGVLSVITGGKDNTASGLYAGVFASHNSTASGARSSAVIAGSSCTSSNYQTLAKGSSCQATGNGSTALGGTSLVASGDSATAIGGAKGTASGEGAMLLKDKGAGAVITNSTANSLLMSFGGGVRVEGSNFQITTGTLIVGGTTTSTIAGNLDVAGVIEAAQYLTATEPFGGDDDAAVAGLVAIQKLPDGKLDHRTLPRSVVEIRHVSESRDFYTTEGMAIRNAWLAGVVARYGTRQFVAGTKGVDKFLVNPETGAVIPTDHDSPTSMTRWTARGTYYVADLTKVVFAAAQAIRKQNGRIDTLQTQGATLKGRYDKLEAWAETKGYTP